MKVRINEINDELYCVYSKEKIEIGEAYIEDVEYYLGDRIIKAYKKEYADVLAEDDLYIDENYEEYEWDNNFYSAEGFDKEDLEDF